MKSVLAVVDVTDGRKIWDLFLIAGDTAYCRHSFYHRDEVAGSRWFSSSWQAIR